MVLIMTTNTTIGIYPPFYIEVQSEKEEEEEEEEKFGVPKSSH
jgi:hypothetical protein